MAEAKNPLVSDREVDFQLYDVLDVPSLCRLPYFRDHSRETFDLYLRTARRLAREILFPTYRSVDQSPPELKDGAVKVHQALHDVYRQLVAAGVVSASKSAEVGGQQLPLAVATAANLYLMAANLSAFGFTLLTAGSAHLLENFGSDDLKRAYMERMYAGEWTGTMALTEPQAGSSLADVATIARPAPGGHFLLSGSKIFISGGDHDLAENVVHLVLARIEGAPAGTRGISLFCVPKRRVEGGRLVENDVRVTGLIHKIGWRGLPSLAMSFGEEGDCRGWLVGKPNQGLGLMFQMMNEARISVGCHAVATASVAYQESLLYALERPQGRPLASRDPTRPQVPIVEHADVRRMLLRQKAIVEGGLSLVLCTAHLADLAGHAEGEEERRKAKLLLDLLTPVAKSFPAEAGFESNALAVQIHGGYGYSSEYLPEAWMRDQKLNSIHEGTTGIQGLDLLGRRVVAEGGEPLRLLLAEVESTAARARKAGVDPAWADRLLAAGKQIGDLTIHLGGLGLGGDVEAMMRHSADYLRAFSILVVGWQWLRQAAVALEVRAHRPELKDFAEGKLCAAQYFLATELPQVELLAELCRSGEDSYARVRPEWL